MPFVIAQRVEIAAPADVVWRVLTDFDHYGEWNPFVVACRSTLVVGESIEMRVHVFRRFAQSQTEYIVEHDPGRTFSYGVRDAPLGAMRSRRSHKVVPIDSGRTLYDSHFELGGWLAPVTRALLGTRLRRGFGEMTDAVARRSMAVANGTPQPAR